MGAEEDGAEGDGAPHGLLTKLADGGLDRAGDGEFVREWRRRRRAPGGAVTTSRPAAGGWRAAATAVTCSGSPSSVHSRRTRASSSAGVAALGEEELAHALAKVLALLGADDRLRTGGAG